VNNHLYRWRKKNLPQNAKDSSGDLGAELLGLLKKRLGAELETTQVCDRLGVSHRVLQAAVEDLCEAGYIITLTDESIRLHKVAPAEENEYTLDWSGDRIIRFGVVADTHLGSKWQQLTHLNTLYDIFEREGIETVYHAGDITEGVDMRKGHEFEVFAHGADAQVEYVTEKYPKRGGIVTKFITGNHDHSAIKHSGHDIGVAMANKRPDLVYLGRSQAKVYLTPNCILEINHPLDGAAYALSYALQKMIDAMSGGEKPNIYLGGHHHKTMYLFYRNIHAFECGTTQAQTPWMRGKRLPAHVGGWIIEVHVDAEGTITRCIGEFIPFYTSVEDDY
jgi:predicted phosphodiesterase